MTSRQLISNVRDLVQNFARDVLLTPAYDLHSKKYDSETCEVFVRSRVDLGDYEAVTPSSDMRLLKAYAKALTGKKIMFINATYAGGGVAIMRAPLIALLQSLGVDAHWYVMRPDEAAFDVTKRKFHNVLQDVAGEGVELKQADKVIYERWVRQNCEAMAEPLRQADVIVIDDWQPSGLIPYIKGGNGRPGLNPDAKLIFRNHIQTEGKLMGTPGTPQYTTWNYIWDHNQVSRADVFITHPKPEFVPPDVPDEKVVYMPATSDLLDDLNRSLTAAEASEGLEFINDQLARNEEQKPLDTTRPYLVLIARFDPSKGMPLGMKAYASARQQLAEQGLPLSRLPQLVVVGNGSVDDPDGIPVLAEVMRLRSDVYGSIKDDIKVARVPHNDIAINALLSGSTLALQPSTKEGFESRVTDAIMQGVPVIGSDRGGISLQIVDGQSGYVIDPYDTTQWAARICEFMTDTKKADYMRRQTKKLAVSHNYQFTTVPNAINWLYLSDTLLRQPKFKGNRRWVRKLAERTKQERAVGVSSAHRSS